MIHETEPEEMLNLKPIVFDCDEEELTNSPEVQTIRKFTCFTCYSYVKDTMNCGVCDCPVIMLSIFKNKRCPKDKW